MTKIGYNTASGLIFVAIGAFFSIYSLIDLDIGTAFRMGPGYFPLILGAALVLVGGAMAMGADSDGEPNRAVPWRAVLLILLALTLFGLTIRGIGLVPGVALTVLSSALASRRSSLRVALVLTTVITLFCVLVFHVGLGLPIELFGPWLEFG